MGRPSRCPARPDTRGSRMVKMLLEHGARSNVTTRDGLSPLHLAALSDLAAVKMIVASIGGKQLLVKKNNAGLTPQELAQICNKTASVVQDILGCIFDARRF